MKRFCALVLLLCAAWAPSEAKIKLPAIVGDNMVLQQSCEVKLWGWAAPEAEVSVAPRGAAPYGRRPTRKDAGA